MEGKENSKLKVVIVVLAVLLAVSLMALAGILLYNHWHETQPTSVVVPNNIITPEEGENAGSGEPPADSGAFPDAAASGSDVSSAPSASASGLDAASHTTTMASSADVTATALSLHNRNADDNTPFQLGNLFPGDSETQYYCVRVSHKGDVILRFHADVRPGYEKLAEVLQCRVVLPENGDVLYDGLMRDMPASLTHALRTSTGTTSEVYYEITAYLDTSVGNEYMNKELMADFRWWVEETENLVSPPTGDSFPVYVWLCLAAGSLFLLILLWRKRKKEDAVHER